MSADQGQPSRYIFGKKEGFFDHNLSGSCTNVTHVFVKYNLKIVEKTGARISASPGISVRPVSAHSVG